MEYSEIGGNTVEPVFLSDDPPMSPTDRTEESNKNNDYQYNAQPVSKSLQKRRTQQIHSYARQNSVKQQNNQQESLKRGNSNSLQRGLDQINYIRRSFSKNEAARANSGVEMLPLANNNSHRPARLQQDLKVNVGKDVVEYQRRGPGGYNTTQTSPVPRTKQPTTKWVNLSNKNNIKKAMASEEAQAQSTKQQNQQQQFQTIQFPIVNKSKQHQQQTIPKKQQNSSVSTNKNHGLNSRNHLNNYSSLGLNDLNAAQQTIQSEAISIVGGASAQGSKQKSHSMAPSILPQQDSERFGKSSRPKHQDLDFSVVMSSMTASNFNTVPKKKATRLDNNQNNFHDSLGDQNQYQDKQLLVMNQSIQGASSFDQYLTGVLTVPSVTKNVKDHQQNNRQ